MHMLEAHVVKFIRQHKFPLGFFGEQGGESIHHEFREFADAHPGGGLRYEMDGDARRLA